MRGKGPIIPTPIRTMEQVAALRPMEARCTPPAFPARQQLTPADPAAGPGHVAALHPPHPASAAVRTPPPPSPPPPAHPRFRSSEVGAASTVLGFVGTPWTLAAYAVEGGADKSCTRTKAMMTQQPAVLHALLAHLADALGAYAAHQVDAGAQVVQLFDSWAHHLSPAQFREFSLPYAERVMAAVRARHPHVPLIFHANGSAGKERAMAPCTADVLGLDWGTDMRDARALLGPSAVLQGNVDPQLLFGPEDVIAAAVRAGGRQRRGGARLRRRRGTAPHPQRRPRRGAGHARGGGGALLRAGARGALRRRPHRRALTLACVCWPCMRLYPGNSRATAERCRALPSAGPAAGALMRGAAIMMR